MKTVEAYIDGTTVRTLENYSFDPNQKVYITIPSEEEASSTDKDRIRRKNQFEAIKELSTLFDKSETAAIEESFSSGIKFKKTEL